jgi:hypothetical protein
VVDGYRDTVGTYQFRMMNFSAAPLLLDSQVATGELSPQQNITTYRIEGKPGQQLTLDWQGSNSNNLSWALYDPANQLVAAPTGNIADLTTTLLLQGSYTLVLKSLAAIPVAYNFAVQRAEATIQNQGLGLTYSGNLTGGSGQDTYTFTAIAGTRIYIDALNESSTARLTILRPDGTPVPRSSGVLLNQSASLNEPLLLDQSGTYTVSFTATSAANYKVQLWEMPVNPPARGSEQLLQLDVVTRGQIPSNGVRVYSFAGQAGQRLRYDLLTGGSSVGVEVYAPSGKQVTTPSGELIFPYGGADSSFFTLSESGTYHFVLNNKTSASADIKFHVLDMANVEQVQASRNISGSFVTNTAAKFYRFQGKVGQIVTIAGNSSNSSNQGVRILSLTNYQEMVSEFLGAAPIQAGNIRNIRLTQNGEYLIQIAPDQFNTNRNYNFNFFLTDPETAIVSPGKGEDSAGTPIDNPFYRVQVTAEDGKGGQAEQDYLIRVMPDPSNTAPIITSLPPETGFTDRRYAYQVEANDADGDKLTYLLLDAPAGMLINSTTGKILWTIPTIGAHQIKVRVDDRRGGVATQVFTLTVTEQSGRISGSIYADIDGNGQRKITNPGNLKPYETVAVGDENNPANRFQDDYAVYALGTPNGVPGILGGVGFKDDNTLFLGGGAASEGGVLYTVKVLRGEGGHIIGFDDDGDPETYYSADYFADSPYSDASVIQLQGGTIWANQWPTSGVTVIQPGTTPYEVLPNRLGGMTFVPTGLPGAGQLKAVDAYSSGGRSGFYTINYVLDNVPYGDGTKQYSITGVQSSASFLSGGPGGFVYMPTSAKEFGVPHVLIAEWKAGQVASYKLDAQGNPIPSTREVFIDNYNGAWGAIIDPVTNDLIFTPWRDEDDIIIVRRLGKPSKNEAGLNDWIVYVDADKDGTRDANELFTYTDTLGNYSFELAPGTYRIAHELQRGWTQTNPTNPIYWDVTLVAGDVEYSRDFAVTNNRLAGANVDPEFISVAPTAPIKTGGQLIYQAAATDLNGDPLSYDLVINPEGMSISTDGTLSWVPSDQQVGNHQVIIRVKDDRGGVALQAFQLEVEQGNRLPMFTSKLPTINPREGQEFRFQAKAIDLDGDNITYEIVRDARTTPRAATTSDPTGLKINATTGLVTWTPKSGATEAGGERGGAFNWGYGLDAVEPWEVLIRATDGKGGESFQRLSLIVDAAPTNSGINRAPEITSKPRKLTGINQPYVYEIEASDPDGDNLSYELLPGAPAGLTLTGRMITWTPTAAQLGAQSFQVKVLDGRGGSVTQAVSVLVSNQVSNQAPMITDSPTVKRDLESDAIFQTVFTETDNKPQRAITGQIYAYDFKGVDRDGDITAWSLLQGPDGMVIDVTTGALRWQPKLSQINNTGYDVVVVLTDSYGASDTVKFKLIVNGSNLPPQVLSTPVTIAAQGQSYRYAIQAADPENGKLAYTLGRKPVGMTIDATTGLVAWNPATAQIGDHLVEVIVTDVLGATVMQQYTLKIFATLDPQGNRAPVISSTPGFLSSPGQAYSYQVVATDPDPGAVLTYSLLKAPAGMTISSSGLITWNPSLPAGVTSKEEEVVVQVNDGLLGVGQGYRLTVRQNNVPTIETINSSNVVIGTTYRYDVKAQDLDGDVLTYAINQAAIDRGVSIDSRGRMVWMPQGGDLSSALNVIVTVKDVQGATATQSFSLTAVTDVIAPTVTVQATRTSLNIGESVTYQV